MKVLAIQILPGSFKNSLFHRVICLSILSIILSWFNVSPHMIKIFKTMLNGKMAEIQTSDGLLDIFLILVGVAHGDSLSGLIFLLAIEPFLWKIKYSNNIEKLTVANDNLLSDASFADDVTLVNNIVR